MKIGFTWLALFFVCCAAHPANKGSQPDSATSQKPLAEVLSEHTAEWMNIQGVEGTGETLKDGRPAIIIFVDSVTNSLRAQLPNEVEGYSVVLEPSGRVEVR